MANTKLSLLVRMLTACPVSVFCFFGERNVLGAGSSTVGRTGAGAAAGTGACTARMEARDDSLPSGLSTGCANCCSTSDKRHICFKLR